MRKFRAVLLAIALTAGLVVSQGPAVYAAPGTKVKGVGSAELNGLVNSFSFDGSGSGTKFSGGFLFIDSTGRSVSGKVSCIQLMQATVGNTVVLVGQINQTKTDGNALGQVGDYLVITAFDSTSGDTSDRLNVTNVGSSNPGCRAAASPTTTQINRGGYIKITP
jgi:hypothetical protein